MPRRVQRALVLLAVVVGAAWVAWLTWPRPDLYIRVLRGGTAQIVRTLGAPRPLPDTVYVDASAPATVRIENEDTVTHRLGIFAVARGATSEFTMSQPGTYSGFCSAHPGRRLTYVVR